MIPATLSSAGPVAVATTMVSPTPTPMRSARDRGRITAPPASSAPSAASRSPAVNASRPSAAKSAPRIATASRRVPANARSNEAIGRRARHAVDRRDLALQAVVPDRGGGDRRQDLVAGHHLAQPGRRRRAGVGRHGTQRDHHGQADHEGADRDGGPSPVAGDGRAGETLLEAKRAGERQAGDAPERAEDRRRHEDREQEDEVDRDGPQRERARPRRRREEQGGERADEHDDRDQPAGMGPDRGRAVGAGAQAPPRG